MTVRQRAAQFYAVTVFSRADLTASGMTPRDITRAVDDGRLRRLRRDRYAIEPVSAEVAEAVRIGGRLSCVSLLVEIGVFVHLRGALHVHVRPGSSRVRPPRSKHTVLHWNAWSGDPEPLHAAALADALAQAVRCQQPRAAVATLDSILHHGLMSWDELLCVFDRLPERYRTLLALVDPSAESGPETFMRLLLRTLGVAYESQVVLDGVGRVDFLVEGWLIIECDSKEFHQGWEKQVDDRRRDLAAAMKGYITIRPLASDILRRDSALREAVDAVVRSLGPHFRNAARAQLPKK